MNFFVAYSGRDESLKKSQNTSSESFVPKTPFLIDWLKAYHCVQEEDTLLSILEDATQQVNLENLFSELNLYAAKWYGVLPSLSIEFRDNTLAISQRGDTVYMNTVMSSALFSFIAVQLYRSYLIDNAEQMGNHLKEEEMFCYRYSLFVMNDICFGDFKQPVIPKDGESMFLLLSKFLDKPNLPILASNLFYTSVAFALLHEISHAYMHHKEQEASSKKEFEADANAYRIFLEFCDDVYSGRVISTFRKRMQPYTYMAPMYLFDFYYMVFYTSSFLCLYHAPASKDMLQEIVDRKNALINAFDLWDGGENDSKADDLYNAFLDGTESFLRSFIASDKAGYLDSIKDKNWRRTYG